MVDFFEDCGAFGFPGVGLWGGIAIGEIGFDVCTGISGREELFFSFPNEEAFLSLFIDEDHLRGIFHVYIRFETFFSDAFLLHFDSVLQIEVLLFFSHASKQLRVRLGDLRAGRSV